mmetsp:Transcript_74243/g.209698  ORF Transcript_74243/g.209698 Transcript_74243/m.209698 type:complete len:290 (-) Transcript_74243:131-1000(-)
MCEDHVVRREVGLPVLRALAAGRVLPGGVAQHGRAPRLVQRDPGPHQVPEGREAGPGVVLEVANDLPPQPAAVLVLEALGKVPVVEGHQRRYRLLLQLGEERPVELDGLGVRLAPAGRQQAGPGDGEAVRVQAQLFHQRDVLAELAVVVAGHLPRVPVPNLVGQRGEGVPDARRAAALGCGALDLVRGCGASPDKPFRKRQDSHVREDVEKGDVAFHLLRVRERHEHVDGRPRKHLGVGRDIEAVGRQREDRPELRHRGVIPDLDVGKPGSVALGCGADFDLHGRARHC